MTVTSTRLLSGDAEDGAWIERVFALAEREAPEDLTLELIEGEIVISGAPDGNHERIVSRVNRQITRLSAEEMDTAGRKGLLVPVGGGCPRDHVIPDLTVAPVDADVFKDAPGWMPPGGVVLVLAATSGNAHGDREGKRHCYARAGIPLYLLADRERREAVLFSDPDAGDYTRRLTLPFGKDVDLPEPFGFALSTADF